MKRWLLAATLLVAGALIAQAPRAQTAPPEPEGYRDSAYRAPVPATLKGAIVIDTRAAFDLWRAKSAAFIDALPHAPKPDGLPKNVVWREQPRFDIPGSLWLPDTGYGALSDATQHYLEKGLDGATRGDKQKPLVFYCLADCWMSWNAAKRAMTMGYSRVYWYPQGTDGWAAANHPLAENRPAPRD